MNADAIPWYYSNDRQAQTGPVSAADLRALAERGTLHPDALVWREGMAQWQPLHTVAAELGMASMQVTAPVGPPATGHEPAVADTPASPYAAPDTEDLLAASPVHGGAVVYAGFWKRVAAVVIDSAVTAVASWLVQVPLLVMLGVGAAAVGGTGMGDGPMGILVFILAYGVGILIPLLYMSWMHSSAWQATLGKMAVGIKVTRTDGRRISFWRAFGRYWAYMLSALTLMIGYLMAAFTQRKQALHDMICDTLVVDKWAYTEHPDWQKPELGVVTIVILVLGGVVTIGLFALFGLAMYAVGQTGGAGF